jgi:hypothetical protein
MKLPNKRILTFSCLLSILSFALLSVIYIGYSPKKQKKDTFTEVTNLYFSGKLDAAYDILMNSSKEIFKHKDSCELMISVSAEKKEWLHVEQFSRTCLENKRPVAEIAFDGLAASAKELGRIDTSIEYLENNFGNKCYLYDRCNISLAHLYLYKNKIDKAAKLFLQTIESSAIWSAWTNRALNTRKLSLNKKFIADLINTLETKNSISSTIVNKIEEEAIKHKLFEEIKTLKKKTQSNS